VPPGLVAICRRAMARDPRNRYATAEELAADIRRWLTDEPVTVYREPWTASAARWARRRKTAVVAAAVLLLTATVASVATAGIVWAEQRQTKKEWERAEAETVKANENAETALTVVRDLSSYVNFIESSEGMTDQKRKTMLDAALTSYERLLALHPGDPELKSNVARTHRYRANLSRLVNDLDEAERSYREANRLYKALADDHPDEPRYRIDLALGSRDYALRTRGRLKDSLAILSESIQLYEGLHKAEPSKASLQRTLAIVLLDRAELDFQLGDLAGTEQDARRSRDLYAALADAVDYKAELLDPLFRSMAEVRLAVTLRELNRIEEALTVHNQVVERLDGLAKLSATRDHLHELARARGERAVTWMKSPDKRAAGIAEFDLVINACEKLAKQFPQFPAYQRSQGMWTMQRGRLNRDLGKSASAASDAAAATAILEGLVAKYPAIPIYRSFLGQIYILRGQLESDAGKSAGWYAKARDALNAALTTSPDNALDRKALSDVEALVRTSKP
jgi:tetratricopeptide (TPR) repeat protein